MKRYGTGLLAFLIVAISITGTPSYGQTEPRADQVNNTVDEKRCPLPELPQEFKLEHGTQLRYKDYVVFLRNYSHPREENQLSNLVIMHWPDCSLDYYELGFPPAYGEPMMIFEQRKGPPLLLVHATLSDEDRDGTLLRVYPFRAWYNHTSLRIGSYYHIPEIVGDFDGDGYLEVLNLEMRVAGIREPRYFDPEFGTASVYRYVPAHGTGGERTHSPVPGFVRLKGRTFESYFMKHARALIDKDYPDILKCAKGDIELPGALWGQEQCTELLEPIVLNWLATVESTHNPTLIKQALQWLKTLPYPDAQRKKELVRMLIADGYTMLKQNPKKH